MRTLICLMLIVLLTGCDYMGGTLPFMQKEEPKPAVNRIANPDLAKMILVPEREKLQVARDPFKPLFDRTSVDVKPAPVRREKLDVTFVGAFKVEGQARALLQVDGKKDFYGIQDKIKGYIIESIDMDEVILSNEENQMTIKRSDAR